MTIDHWRRQGEAADRLLFDGRADDADRAYDAIVAAMLEQRKVDQFILSKIALGKLLVCIVRKDYAAAGRIWRLTLDDANERGEFLGVGVWGLEEGRVEAGDIVRYRIISAFLTSLSRTEPERWADQIAGSCEKIVDHGLAHDSTLAAIALVNWRLHLDELFAPAPPPSAHIERWQRVVDRTGFQPPDRLSLRFPDPTGWDDAEARATFRPQQPPAPRVEWTLPTWIRLSLVEPMTAPALCEALARHGVRASVTDNGLIHFDANFTAHVDPTTATLQISGGTLEVERSMHDAPPREAPGDGKGRCSAARKVDALARIVRVIAPLAGEVVLPHANQISYPASELARVPADDSFWIHAMDRLDADGPFVATCGAFVYGLPDAAMPVAPGQDPDVVAGVLRSLVDQMIGYGWWPAHGTAMQGATLGPMLIERVMDAVFVVPERGPAPSAVAIARRRFALQRTAGRILGPHTLHHTLAGQNGIAVEHYLRPGQPGVAITSGVSFRSQRGGTPENRNHQLELCVFSNQLGRWAEFFLGFVADFLFEHDGSRPVMAYDRVLLKAPHRDIAGVIPFPSGSLQPSSDPADEVTLWDLLPIETAELAQFRADPAAQHAWVNARLDSGDIPRIHERWARVV